MPVALTSPQYPPPPRSNGGATDPHAPTRPQPYPPAPSAAALPNGFAPSLPGHGPPPLPAPQAQGFAPAPPPNASYLPPAPPNATAPVAAHAPYAPPPLPPPPFMAPAPVPYAAPAAFAQTFSPPPQAPPPPLAARRPPPPAADGSVAAAPPGPFALEPHKDDTALFRDLRASFSHLLPGRPSLGTVRPSDGAVDAVVHLQDAPITVRYRLEPAWQRAQSAAEAALVAAQHMANLRAKSEVTIDHANETWLSSWGAEAAAVCNYELESGTREDLFVLARGGMVMIVTWTYPAGLVEDPAYAAFASVAEATMVWDPQRWDQRGRVWPESPFLGPGLYGAPRPVHNEACRQLSLVPIEDDERLQLLSVLSGIVSTAGAPWMELGGDLHEAHRRAMLSGARHPSLRGCIESSMADVRTCHDLRGMAVMLGRAIERRRGSSPPGGARARSGVVPRM